MRIKDTTVNRQIAIQVICEKLKVSEQEMLSKGRFRAKVMARQIATKIFRDHFNMTYTEIARCLSKNRRTRMDHTTIMHSYRVACNLNDVQDASFHGHFMACLNALEAIADRLQYVRVFAKGERLEALESFLKAKGYDYEVPKPMNA